MGGIELAELPVGYLTGKKIFLVAERAGVPEAQLFVDVAPGTDMARYGAVDIEYYQFIPHLSTHRSANHKSVELHNILSRLSPVLGSISLVARTPLSSNTIASTTRKTLDFFRTHPVKVLVFLPIDACI